MSPKLVMLAITYEDEPGNDLVLTEVLKLKNHTLDLRAGNDLHEPNFERIPLQYGGNAAEFAIIAHNGQSEIRVSWEAFDPEEPK